jgi:peptidoglycan/LPS O-acetylase OafA/YrhL
LISNLVFLNFLCPSLPGVFVTNPFSAVNGALWAIRVEMLFYALVPLIVYLYRRTGNKFVFAVIYIISVGAAVLLQHLESTTGIFLYHYIKVELAMQMAYFISGGLIYYYFDTFLKHRTVLAICSIIIIITNNYFRLALLEPLAFSIIVIYLGSSFYYLGNFSKYGDISYGFFIIHFPILQILVSLGIMRTYPLIGLFTALILSLTGSLGCWYLIAKPLLHRESHYISASV